MHGLLPRDRPRSSFYSVKMGKPWWKLPREIVVSPSLEILTTCQDTTLYNPTLNRGFGHDNLKKYCINNSVILLNVPHQPSPKELQHCGVQPGVGVHIPILTPRVGRHLMELDGRSTTKLHQVLLNTAHCHNSDYSNFLQGNEIFSNSSGSDSDWKQQEESFPLLFSNQFLS